MEDAALRSASSSAREHVVIASYVERILRDVEKSRVAEKSKLLAAFENRKGGG